MMQHADLSLILFRANFYMGIIMDPCSFSYSRALFIRSSLPGLRFRSPLRCFQWWPSFVEQSSRSELVHTVIEGLINWRQYMVRSGIHFLCLIFLYDVCQTPMLVMLGWLWWPMLVCTNALTRVMTDQGTWCEDYFSCHACTNYKPWC